MHKLHHPKTQTTHTYTHTHTKHAQNPENWIKRKCCRVFKVIFCSINVDIRNSLLIVQRKRYDIHCLQPWNLIFILRVTHFDGPFKRMKLIWIVMMSSTEWKIWRYVKSNIVSFGWNLTDMWVAAAAFAALCGQLKVFSCVWDHHKMSIKISSHETNPTWSKNKNYIM